MMGHEQGTVAYVFLHNHTLIAALAPESKDRKEGWIYGAKVAIGVLNNFALPTGAHTDILKGYLVQVDDSRITIEKVDALVGYTKKEGESKTRGVVKVVISDGTCVLAFWYHQAKQETASEAKTRAAKENHKLQRSVRLANRLSALEEKNRLAGVSEAEMSELRGLEARGLLMEEQYTPLDFTPEHRAFKAMHNAALVALAKYCQSVSSAPINIFYLDGPDGGTTSALIKAGFAPAQCFTANRHDTTTRKLLLTGLPKENVVHATATEALSAMPRGAFGNISFSALYLDGCGGYAPLLIEILQAAFFFPSTPQRNINLSGGHTEFGWRGKVGQRVAVGFSLVGGNREFIEKEQQVFRALASIARRNHMRLFHVLDEPEQYGLDHRIRKVDGTTLTSWCLLETTR
eukprot:gb/GEZN01006683.1/.p1 GENE.gb/GEZN01006683.1/~~gb/GEZN01006683.1/.p1  ORF type:complete len:404 (+),score=44.13 gb/GEZN01006683.1/:311-1522(+)